MKIKLKGQIGSIAKSENSTSIVLNFKGSVSDAPINAKEASLMGTLIVKPLVADKLRIGSEVTVEISDDISWTDGI